MIAALLALQYLFGDSTEYIWLQGSLSGLIEATLALPQLVNNQTRKSTRGLSYGLIGSWFWGDIFKAWYYYSNNEPMQLVLCASF